MIPAAAGDVLAVVGGGIGGYLVNVGQAIANKPSMGTHVAIVTHQDVKGRWIGIDGQPGGVALYDCTMALNDSRTRSNHTQSRANDHGQLSFFLASCVKSLGIRYDWAGIAADAAALISKDLSADIDHLWRWPSDTNRLPGAVVCSSLAAMLYDLKEVGWKHPDLGTERACEPSDWWDWSDGEQWLK